MQHDKSKKQEDLTQSKKKNSCDDVDVDIVMDYSMHLT